MFKPMKRSNQRRFRLIHAVLMGGVACTALADIPEDRYSGIVTRNPFGLKPPPPPPPPPDPDANRPPLQLADVTLTGMTSIFANKRALLEIIPAPGKPAIKATLAEGERIESVELVTIDLDKNEVTIKNGTVLTNITFKIAKSGPTTPAPPPAGVAVPGFNPPKPPPPQAAAYGVDQSGGRYNVMVAGGGGSPAPAPAAFNAGVNPGGTPSVGNRGAGVYGGVSPVAAGVNDGPRTLPQRPIRSILSQADSQSAQNPPMSENDRAKQYIDMLAREKVAQQQGRPHPPAPPIPGLE
jgi:hypothetical protein